MAEPVETHEEPVKEFKYVAKTDEELKQIARDLYSGKIFCDRHCSNPKDFNMVFMVLGFMDDDQLQGMRDNKISFIYEYIDKAGPRSINGMPSFFSMQALNEQDSEKMFDYFETVKKAMESI